MGKLVAIALGTELVERVRAETRQIRDLSVEETSPGRSSDVIGRHRDELELVLVGESVEDPVRTAQRTFSAAPTAPVLILSSAARLGDVARAVLLAPLLGSDVRCLSDEDPDAVAAQVHETIDRTRRAGAHRATLRALDARLAAAGPTAPASHPVFLERLLDHAPIAVVALDAGQRVTAWNTRAAQMFARTERAVLGRPFVDVLDAPGDAWSELLDAPSGGRVTRIVGSGPDGRSRLEVVSTRWEGQRGIETLLLVEDVTERLGLAEELRRSEARFRSLALASSHVVFSADADGQVREDSPSWRLFTGQDTTGLLGGGWLDALRPDDRDRARAAWHETLRTGVGHEIEVRLRRPDGGYTPVVTRVAAVTDAEGRLCEWVSASTDITEQVFARSALEWALEDARQANRRKDEFLAMLGHELRNPLAPIVTGLQLMRLKEPASPTDRERRVIERQVRHLVGLVDDLLDISKVTRGKIQLDPERTELSSSIARAVEMVTPLLDERRHRLELQVPETGLAVWGDPKRLAQIFANLLTNAARYTDPGGELRITAEGGSSEIEVRVRDDGIGIGPLVLPHVFEPFFQQTQPLDRQQGGLGIGLSIVRAMVELHGGRVGVTSELGRGSEFVVTLPRAPNEEAPGSPSPAPSETMPAGSLSGLRILLVDDNRDAVTLLADALRAEGCRVEVAFDPPEGLAAARRDTYDVALLDIGLPIMDGYALAHRLRALPGGARLRLVALTGYGQEQDRERTRGAGFERHLVKPVSLETLRAVLGEPRTA